MCSGSVFVWRNHFIIKSLCAIQDLYIIKICTQGFYQQTLISYKTGSGKTFLAWCRCHLHSRDDFRCRCHFGSWYTIINPSPVLATEKKAMHDSGTAAERDDHGTYRQNTAESSRVRRSLFLAQCHNDIASVVSPANMGWSAYQTYSPTIT